MNQSLYHTTNTNWETCSAHFSDPIWYKHISKSHFKASSFLKISYIKNDIFRRSYFHQFLIFFWYFTINLHCVSYFFLFSSIINKRFRAIQVFPAETRLTVYRRRPVLPVFRPCFAPCYISEPAITHLGRFAACCCSTTWSRDRFAMPPCTMQASTGASTSPWPVPLLIRCGWAASWCARVGDWCLRARAAPLCGNTRPTSLLIEGHSIAPKKFFWSMSMRHNAFGNFPSFHALKRHFRKLMMASASPGMPPPNWRMAADKAIMSDFSKFAPFCTQIFAASHPFGSGAPSAEQGRWLARQPAACFRRSLPAPLYLSADWSHSAHPPATDRRLSL